MGANIDVFDTYYMAGMVKEITPTPSFFKDRYFGEEDPFSTDKVLIEFMDGDQTMVPFIAPRVGDIPVDREGYQIFEFEPSLIAPSRILSLDDLKKRGFGEALFAGSTPAERAKKIQLRDLTDLDRRIARREEWMAAQTIINNGVDMVEFIDADTQGQTVPIRFYDTSGSNPGVYTVSPVWTTWALMCADVVAMCDALSKRGLPVSDLVLGSTTWATVKGFTGLLDELDNRSIDVGQIRASIAGTGVTYLGKLNFEGYMLDVFVARETYVDASGVTQLYFPAKSAMVSAPACGKTYYGAVTQIDYGAEEFETYTGRRIPKLCINQEKDIRKLRLAARPITAPKNKAPWIYAANVVS